MSWDLTPASRTCRRVLEIVSRLGGMAPPRSSVKPSRTTWPEGLRPRLYVPLATRRFILSVYSLRTFRLSALGDDPLLNHHT